MQTLTVSLTKATLLLEIRQRSHLGVQNIQDPEARDNVRAGVEKTDEIERCLDDAIAQLRRRCYRYLTATTFSSGSYSFTLSLSSRRKAVKDDAVTEVMNEFAVQYALAKFYSTVSQSDLSNKHSALAIDAGNQLDELLYTKKEPTYV